MGKALVTFRTVLHGTCLLKGAPCARLARRGGGDRMTWKANGAEPCSWNQASLGGAVPALSATPVDSRGDDRPGGALPVHPVSSRRGQERDQPARCPSHGGPTAGPRGRQGCPGAIATQQTATISVGGGVRPVRRAHPPKNGSSSVPRKERADGHDIGIGWALLIIVVAAVARALWDKATDSAGMVFPFRAPKPPPPPAPSVVRRTTTSTATRRTGPRRGAGDVRLLSRGGARGLV